MKEYAFTELGYFSKDVCEKIKKYLQGKTYMNFDVHYSNAAGNCILIIATDYDDTEENIKNFFLSAVLRYLANEAKA